MSAVRDIVHEDNFCQKMTVLGVDVMDSRLRAAESYVSRDATLGLATVVMGTPANGPVYVFETRPWTGGGLCSLKIFFWLCPSHAHFEDLELGRIGGTFGSKLTIVGAS